MGRLDSLDKLLAFVSISDVMRNELVEINKDTKMRLKHAEAFFEETAKTLKSIVRKRGAYGNTESLREILESAGYYLEGKELPQQEKDVRHIIEEFEGYSARLKVLEKNPRLFYSEETFKRKSLLLVCEKMRHLYQEQVYKEYSKDNRTLQD
jgi:hypothetical protein